MTNTKPDIDLILFNKPFQVLSQFSAHEGKDTLANWISIPGVYAAGRLDYDSEGLMILTNHGGLQALIANPKHKLTKTYWVQVEGEIHAEALRSLCEGVVLKDGKTKPATATLMEQPELWPRNPPVRYRANIPTSWISLTISEGKNRQVRRMTAAVGFPTLRLIRAAIGSWTIAGLLPGEWMRSELPQTMVKQLEKNEARNKARPTKIKSKVKPAFKNHSQKTHPATKARRPTKPRTHKTDR